MRLYPAIDIKDGQCVRLKKGLFNEVTVYSDTPYKIAESFEKDGAKFIHTVDLDGALKGRSVNAETIKKIVNSVNIPVQLGGGIRTLENIQEVLAFTVRLSEQKPLKIRILSVRRLTVLVRNTSLWELMQRTVMLL